MATAHFDIQPEDGWVEITSAGIDLIHITKYPASQPIFVTTASSTPALTVVGFRVDCDFWVDVPVTEKFYARVTNALQGEGTRVYVFTVPS